MKILYLGRYNESEELTGPEKVAKRIYHESSKVNETVFVEYFFDGSQYSLFKKIFGNEVVNKDSNIYRFGIFKFLYFLFKFKPKIIHIITFERFAVLASFYKLFPGVKVIYNVHGVAVHENKNFKNVSSSLKKKDAFCERKIINLSDSLLFLSDFQLMIARDYYEIPDAKVTFINNGVDPDFNKSGPYAAKSEIPSIVFIGDSERKDKDFNFLYSNLEKIKNKCNLYLVGNFNEKIYSNKFEKVNIIPIKKMDVSSLVKFLYDKDIFVSSSSYDTFSIATAECMSLGLVPIVTDTTGISKIIFNDLNGFVVKYGNGDELALKINQLLSDKVLRIKMSKESQKIYGLLNWREIFKSYQKIYNQIL